MSKFPKTVAAVQKRDRCMWEIGDALLAECGAPRDVNSQSTSYHDGSLAKLEAVANEIEHLKIEGYDRKYLAILRDVSHKFRGAARNHAISWAAHRSSGSPEMLETIVKAVGSKPVTNAVVRSTRAAIEERQEREYRKENPGKPLPKRSAMPIPSAREVKGLALIAEVARWVSDLKRCDQTILDVSEGVEKQLIKLEAIDIDYLVDIALSLSKRARELADTARKLQSNKRSHLSVVGDRA